MNIKTNGAAWTAGVLALAGSLFLCLTALLTLLVGY
jgi:hypothetical protein